MIDIVRCFLTIGAEHYDRLKYYLEDLKPIAPGVIVSEVSNSVVKTTSAQNNKKDDNTETKGTISRDGLGTYYWKI